MTENCVFCKIIAGEIPAKKRYEDDDMIIIDDLNPQAPVHLLLIPKAHYADVTKLTDESAATLGRCLLKLKDLADSFGLSDGFRLIVNKGEAAGQTVKHLHVHILGGKTMSETII